MLRDLSRAKASPPTDALLVSLCGKRSPGWLNRLSYIGSLVPCLLPRGVADAAAPVDTAASDSNGASATGFYTQPGRLSAAAQRRPAAGPRSTSSGGTISGFSSITPAAPSASIGGSGYTLGGGSSGGSSRPAASSSSASSSLGTRPDREAMAQAALRRSEMQKAAAAAAASGAPTA